MDAHAENRTRSSWASTPGSPPSSVGPAQRPPTDEGDGPTDTNWLFGNADDDWPGPFGAARLGIP